MTFDYSKASNKFNLNNFKLGGCVRLSWLEQSTSNRKTRARIPAQSSASLFPQKDLKFFKF